MGIGKKTKNYLRPAIFIDRDGVLNDVVDRGEDFFVQGKKVRRTAPFRYDEFHLKSGVPETLEQIGNLGFLRILVTNQPDIAYGTMTPKEHERIMADVKKLPLDDIFVCLHGRNDNCECKKPKPGMLLQAAKKWDIDLASSYIVGDGKGDMEAGRAAGCATILIKTDYNEGTEANMYIDNLAEILTVIKKQNQLIE